MKSLHDFVNSWNWKVTPQANNQLHYTGTRYSYEIRIPVTKPGTQDWIFQSLEGWFDAHHQPERNFAT